MRMMNRIEAIPLESMRLGMRWDWETFPEYMDGLDRQGLGVNVGALFPFSPMRGYVLGMLPARERTSVTGAELNQMKQIFHDAMEAGAFGFSYNKNMEDRPEDGSFLPSHVASKEEFLALSEVLGQFGVGHMGLTLGLGLTQEERNSVRDLTAQMMRTSGRPFSLLDVQSSDDPAWVDSCRQEGLPLIFQRLSTSAVSEFKLAEYNMFDYMPNWVQPLVGEVEERSAKLKDPETRSAMKQDVEEWPNFRTDWTRLRVLQVIQQRNQQYEGMSIKELADYQGKHPLDAFLDLALDEELQTEFMLPNRDDPEELKSREHDLVDPYAPHLRFRWRRPHQVQHQ